MTDLSQLLEKVRTAGVGSRKLDAYLHALSDGRMIHETGNGQILARNSRGPHDEYVLGTIDPGKQSRNFSIGWSDPPTPHYTTSLDAIVVLIERELRTEHPQMVVNLVGRLNAPHDWWSAEITWPSYEMRGSGHTGPLALCAAFLSALISKEKADG